VFLAVFGTASTAASPSIASFKATVPDGLYLFQPDFRQAIFSPLVVVKNGKLVDPNEEIARIGLGKFSKAHVRGKTFFVVHEGRQLGEIKDLVVSKGGSCLGQTFSPEILIEGAYVGDILPGLTQLNVRHPFIQVQYDVPRAAAFPASMKPARSSSNESRVVDKQLADEVWEKARKHLLEDAMDVSRREIERSSSFEVIKMESANILKLFVLDIDRDRRADYVGLAEFAFEVKSRVERDGEPPQLRVGNRNFNIVSIPFVLWSDGRLETFKSFPRYRLRNITLSSALDLDSDGVDELVFQVETTGASGYEIPEFGKRVEIYTRTSTSWAPVYQSSDICSR
jgi:hypothetical protein